MIVDPAVGGGNSQTAFLVESSSVTIEDLTINGLTNTSSTHQFSGGVVTNYVPATDATRSIADPAYDAAPTAQELTVQNVSGDAIAILTQGTGNKVLDNTITNAGGWGIHIHGGSTIITGNTISGTADAVGINAEYDGAKW